MKERFTAPPEYDSTDNFDSFLDGHPELDDSTHSEALHTPFGIDLTTAVPQDDLELGTRKTNTYIGNKTDTCQDT
jgi:hypothetical protein